MKQTLTAFTFSILCSAFAVAATPLIINGSLTGPIANAGVPSGWITYSGSPDTMDENNNVGAGTPFGVNPSGPSPDGGTWVGMAQNAGTGFQEIFGQTVSGFVSGSTYFISWYEGNFGAITGPGYTNPNSIGLSINGVLVGQGALLSLSPTWSSAGVSFVAPSTNLDIRFGVTGSPGPSYLSIDGIAVQEAGSRVPDGGSTAALLAAALLGLVGVGARSKRK